MPLVRIELPQGLTPLEKQALSDSIHRAMVETINVPEQDRFQIIREHEPEDLVIAEEYLGIKHHGPTAIVQIFLNEGRSTALKQALYQRIAESFPQHTPIRIADVIINLVEVKKENWSFGNGLAQYAGQ